MNRFLKLTRKDLKCVFFNSKMKLSIQCVILNASRTISVVGMSWYHGQVTQNRPTLAICYENGKLQIMKNENDECKSIFLVTIQKEQIQMFSFSTNYC